MADKNDRGKPERDEPREQDRTRRVLRSPDEHVGGPDDRTPVAESGDQPGPQGPSKPMQPGGQPNLPT